MSPLENSRRAVNWIALALVVLPPLAIFAPILFADRSLAFRDTAAFYHPLFEWIEQQWQQGELPLWNPHANFGTPLVGEASSSIFYPGKAILLLPLEFSWKFKLYVVGHVFLAAAGAYYAARQFGSSREAATLAAVSYACGGAVLFQYCNIVFLIGAAWLPWAFAAIERMFGERDFRAAIALGVVLALMTLGGDPQMAYHAGLAAAVYGAGLWWNARTDSIGRARLLPSQGRADSIGRARLLPSQEKIQLGGNPALPIGLLATAAIAALVLSAVQTFPAAEAAASSDRAAYHAPRNIYEAARVVAAEKGGLALAAQGLFRDPEPDTHAASIYQFSFAPWHLPEYLWPNFAGRYFPQYRRWMMAWPAEPRMWNQSVYLGLLPLLLAAGSLRLRRGTVRERWLSWCVVLAVLGSFGAFGASWLLHYPLFMAGQPKLATALPGNQVGGVYWFFVTFLPSYAYFRFPAKLLTFAACPICLLAAHGFDRLPAVPRPWLQRAMLAIAATSAVGAVLVLAADGWFAELARWIAPDSVYGPFDEPGARQDMLWSFLHTLVVAGLLLAFLNQKQWIAQRRVTWSLVAITAADLVIANAPLIGTAPSDLWRERPLLAELLERDERERGAAIRPTVRQPVEHDTIDPDGWHASSSPLRLEEWVAADRHLAQTNHALAGPIDSAECLTSLRVADYVYFYRRYRRNDGSFWGNYWIMPQSVRSIDAAQEDNPWQALSSPALREITKCQVFRHEHPFPRAWIVHDVAVLPELTSRDPYDLSVRGEEVVEKDRGDAVVRRDFRLEAVVESDRELPIVLDGDQDLTSTAEMCRIDVSTPNHVIVEAELQRPGLLVLADTYFAGWTAASEQTDQRLPIVRTDRMFRGVALSAGKHRIHFDYLPPALVAGAWVSGLGWTGLLTCLVIVASGIRSQARASNPAGFPSGIAR
jgi:hypothetical protein